MPRDVFPHETDRAVINYFLRGRKRLSLKTGYLFINEGRLVLDAGVGGTLAWFDTAGALAVRVLDGIGYDYSRMAINEMAKQLGIPERELTRERHYEDGIAANGWSFKYFMDGAEIQLNDPIVLVGALGMKAWQAWQASQKP